MRAAAASAALVLLGAVPRLLLASGSLPAFLRPFVWSDILFTWERGISGGQLPYRDTYFEYPPIDGYLSGLFGSLAQTALLYVALWTVVQVAAAAMVGWVVDRRGERGWWMWALAPQLALFGPMNFDLLAVAALVLALRWEVTGARARSTISLAAGTATKLFPAVALPLFLIRPPRACGGVAMRFALFLGLVAASYAPGVAQKFSTMESLTRYTLGIPANFDSIWGMISAALAGLGLPSTTIVGAVTSVGLLATYLVVAVPRARAGGDPRLATGIAVLALLLWSRLYSPQFSLWVLPFFVFLRLPRRAFALLTVADAGVFVTVYPLTLVNGMDETVRVALLAVLAAAIVLRHVGLIVAMRAAIAR